MAQPIRFCSTLLALLIASGCSKSTRSDAHKQPEDEAPAEDEGDDQSEEDAGEEEEDAGESAEPLACVPDGDAEFVPDDPPGNVNGDLDPAGFARLEADQFGTPELIANTFTLAEGPLWDPCTRRLLFSDAEGQKIHTLEADDSIGVYYAPTNYTNGLAFDNQGRLLMAEMGGGKGGRISRLNRALELDVVADHTPTCTTLNTSDDLVVRSDGTIYFTDPVIAHGNYLGFSLTAKPVYRLAPGPDPRKIVRETQASLPNGIRLSPDEKTLYVVGYLEGRVRRFDVAEDGSLTEAAPFASGLSSPDSMCVDAAGNVYVGVSRGLQVFRADGSAVTLIPITSSSGTTNCAFGGRDGKTLFITAWTSLWRVDNVPIPGSDWARNQNMPCEDP